MLFKHLFEYWELMIVSSYLKEASGVVNQAPGFASEKKVDHLTNILEVRCGFLPPCTLLAHVWK